MLYEVITGQDVVGDMGGREAIGVEAHGPLVVVEFIFCSRFITQFFPESYCICLGADRPPLVVSGAAIDGFYQARNNFV